MAAEFARTHNTFQNVRKKKFSFVAGHRSPKKKKKTQIQSSKRDD